MYMIMKEYIKYMKSLLITAISVFIPVFGKDVFGEEAPRWRVRRYFCNVRSIIRLKTSHLWSSELQKARRHGFNLHVPPLT